MFGVLVFATFVSHFNEHVWNLIVCVCTGSSAIFCIPTLPLSLRHRKHLKIIFWTAEFPLVIQFLLLQSSFNVAPLPICANLEWQPRIINVATLSSFGKMIGNFSSSLRNDLFNLPPTHMMSSLSKNGSNWLIFEDLGKGTSHFFPTLAAVKIFNSAENLCCVILIISISLWCKSSLPNSGVLVSNMSFLALLHNIVFYFNMVDTNCFILDHVDILSSSCFNESCLDLAKFAVTSFFSSGSSADICTFVCFTFHALSGCHKEHRPLNHISIASWN